MYDAIIIGGGPAGLSAALVLGRCLRKVIICDGGKPRNAASHEMHGFLSRDGIAPQELLRLGREEIGRYGVEFRSVPVADAAPKPGGGFVATLEDGALLESKKMLLATGVRDQLPRIEGIEERYGTSVHHCPYCDAYERRSQPLIAYGRGSAGVGLGLALRTWSDRVTVCTDGVRLSERDRERAARNGMAFREDKIDRIEGDEGQLQSLVFRKGPPVEFRSLFFNTAQYQRSGLAVKLGCEITRNGSVRTDRRQRTCVPGVYLAGDADKDMQFVIVAAAEGAKAAMAINRELQDEERGK